MGDWLDNELDRELGQRNTQKQGPTDLERYMDRQHSMAASEGPWETGIITSEKSPLAPAIRPVGRAVGGILDLFSRPFYGMHGAVASLGDPKETAGKAFGKGWRGEERKGIPDILDNFLPYWDSPMKEVYGETPANVVRGAIDVMDPIDPLAVIGPLGKIKKVQQATQKATDIVSGSNLGRAFFRKAGGSYTEADKFIDKISYLNRWKKNKLDERMAQLAEDLLPEYDRLMKSGDYKDIQELQEALGEALERPEFRKYFESATRLFEKSKLESKELAIQNDWLRRELGLEEGGLIDEFENNRLKYDYLARHLSAKAKQRKAGWVTSRYEKPRHREILNWVDEGGQIMSTGKFGHPDTGVEKVGKRYFHKDSGREVFMRQASQREAKKVTGDVFINDPVIRIAQDLRNKLDENAYLTFLQEMRKNPEWLIESPEVIPKGWRGLNVPGLEHWVMPKPLANRMDNLGKMMLDPETYLGAIEKTLDNFFNSKIGKPLERYRKVWARTMTGPNPGFHVRNAISNASLLLMSGVPPEKLAQRVTEAILVQRKAGIRAIDGIDNDKLLEELAKRGGINTSWSVSEMGEKLADQYRLTQGIPGVGKAAEKMEGLTDLTFRVGNVVENNAKIAAAIHHIKKARKKGASWSEALDQGAAAARQYLFDYSDLTPLQNLLKNFSPFAAWHINIMSSFAKTAVKHPERLSKMDRLYNWTLTPMPEEERELAPDWIQTGLPVSKIGPIDLGANKEGYPMSFLAGGYQPFQSINELFMPISKREWPRLGGFTWPAPKLPVEGGFNYDLFKERQIDQSGSYLSGLVNPIAGKDDWTKGEELFGQTWPEAWRHLSNLLPGSRQMKQLDMFFESHVRPDPYKPKMSPTQFWWWYITGGKLYPWRTDISAAMRVKDYEKHMKEAQRNLFRARKAEDFETVERITRVIQNLQEKISKAKSMQTGD